MFDSLSRSEWREYENEQRIEREVKEYMAKHPEIVIGYLKENPQLLFKINMNMQANRLLQEHRKHKNDNALSAFITAAFEGHGDCFS